MNNSNEKESHEILKLFETGKLRITLRDETVLKCSYYLCTNLELSKIFLRPLLGIIAQLLDTPWSVALGEVKRHEGI